MVVKWRRTTYNVPTNTIARAFELRKAFCACLFLLSWLFPLSVTIRILFHSVNANVCFPRLFLQHLWWLRERWVILMRFATTIPPVVRKFKANKPYSRMLKKQLTFQALQWTRANVLLASRHHKGYTRQMFSPTRQIGLETANIAWKCWKAAS